VRDHRKSIMTYCAESGLPFGGAIVLHLSMVADLDYRRWMSYECELRWPCSLGGRVLLPERTRNATEVPNLVKYAY
jgi:hypothetical protein